MQELDEHIEKSIRALPVEGGFKVPEGYFDDLKVLVHYQTVYTHQQVERPANLENYFASSRKQILQKTTERIPRSTLSLWQLGKYLGAAASVLMVAGALYWVYQPAPDSANPQLTDEEIIRYLQQDPIGELQVDEVVNIIPANAIPNETHEEDYLMIETL